MRVPLRNIALTLLLVPALALASITVAVARSQAPAVGQVVICTGHGIVTIALDADGNPTEAVHPCPDCVSVQGAPGPAGLPPATRRAELSHLPGRAAGQLPGTQSALLPPSRAPPGAS